MSLHRIFTAILFISTTLLFASACTTVNAIKEDSKVDYRTAKTVPSLEVPPDLNAVSNSGGTTIPGVRAGGEPSTHAAQEQIQGLPTGPQVATAAQVLPSSPNARIERSGTQRWLVVRGDPDVLWGKVRNFFLSTGLLLVVDNPKTGIMETDWAENYADVGNAWQRFQRKYLGAIFDAGTRDKFRIRLERGLEPGTSEIYLSHRRMEEVLKSEVLNQKEFVWQTKPADPDLEAEMLRLLMVHLGVEKDKAQQIAEESKKPVPVNAELAKADNGIYVLTVQDEFNRAWQKVGLSLDRIGFTVEDRNRSDGIYYVRLVQEKAHKKRGFLSRMFTPDPIDRPEQYQVKLEADGTASRVTVNNKDGEPEKSDTSKKILSMLQEQLR